jgi:hypothetical protein
MEKGVSRVTSDAMLALLIMRNAIAQCRNGEICYETECDIACMAWCDELNIEPEQLREAITLIDQMKK